MPWWGWVSIGFVAGNIFGVILMGRLRCAACDPAMWEELRKGDSESDMYPETEVT